MSTSVCIRPLTIAGTLTGVNDGDYLPPFAFTGKLDKVTIKVGLTGERRSDMRTKRTGFVMMAGVGVLLMAGAARADQPVAPGCVKIVAALDESGGTMSADEIAKKTNTDPETVRSCTDAWRAGMKDPKGPAAGKQTAMPPGCAKVVAVLDEHPGLSADEVARKSNADVETVRNCTDLWRKTMPK